MSKSKLKSVSLPKWPMMLTTGKSVTVEQAKEIIFRTDRFLSDLYEHAGGNEREFNEAYRKNCGVERFQSAFEKDLIYLFEVNDIIREKIDFIPTNYVSNDWASCSFIFGAHGWCAPNGTIHYADNIGKWPSVEEVLNDWKKLAKAFPFLDINVTLMDGESMNETLEPLVNIRIIDGRATLRKPDISVHPKIELRNTSDMAMSFGARNELGLPLEWYRDFSARVAKVLAEVPLKVS